MKIQRDSTLLNKLRELKEAAWNLPIKDSRSHRFARKYAAKTSRLISEGVKAVGQEAEETETMARSFFKMLEAKLDLSGRSTPPTEEEVKAAIEQLKDVGRFSIFATLVILPGGVISLLGLELLARRFGIKGFNLIPTSFRRKKKSNLPDISPRSPENYTVILFLLITCTTAGCKNTGPAVDKSSVTAEKAMNGEPGAEWHQWMGPDRSGTWYNGPNVDTLHGGMIESIWETEIGPGYSGPTVAGGKIFAMDYENGSEQVLCFNGENGEKLWALSYPVDYNVGYPTGPRASVQVFDGKAYSFGTMGHVYCLNAGTGEVLWHVNTLERYRSRIPTWGLAANPIMFEDRLILQVGGRPGACLVALNRDTGGEIWRALDDEASYSTPVLISQAGKEVLVCWTGERFAGLDPRDGEILWSVPFKPGNMIMNVASPVYEEPYLFMSGFFDGSYLLKLGQDQLTARLIYHRHGTNEMATDALHCTVSTPVIADGYVYGIDSYGETRCLELISGDRIWEDLTLVPRERWANVHLISQADKTWGFNELGELLLGRFTPAGYTDLGRVKVIDPVKISPNPRNGVCWAHPAFVRNRIYLRSDEKLVCIQVIYP